MGGAQRGRGRCVHRLCVNRQWAAAAKENHAIELRGVPRSTCAEHQCVGASDEEAVPPVRPPPRRGAVHVAMAMGEIAIAINIACMHGTLGARGDAYLRDVVRNYVRPR